MLIDFSALRNSREFRLLYLGQTVSFLGSMMTYVAIPYQVYQLTKSSLMVGLLGTVQLVPVVLFGLIGGSVADRMDRRRLLLVSEALMCVGALALAFNSMAEHPSLAVIFIAVAFMQAATGFHRPAMDAMTQKLVRREDLPSVSALGSFRYSLGPVVGPALGGVLMAAAGARAAYFLDFATFLFALTTLAMMAPPPPISDRTATGLESIVQGLRFAVSRPELLGTYIVDIVAMAFAFCTALFPAMSEQWGGATAAGALFSAMSVGSLVITLFSGWSKRVTRQGAAVVVAAGIWGLATIAFGFAPNLTTALICLGIAGAADMVSGLFRGIIWNETIPNEMRGRLAGIEMISYMTGPLLGNARAGWVATATSTQISIVSGGLICAIGVAVCGWALPAFWMYRSRQPPSEIVMQK